MPIGTEGLDKLQGSVSKAVRNSDTISVFVRRCENGLYVHDTASQQNERCAMGRVDAIIWWWISKLHSFKCTAMCIGREHWMTIGLC